MQEFNWDKIELVIFDVDGTLYNQRFLRQKMLIVLIQYFLLHPLKINDLKILYHFRKEREKHAGFTGVNLEGQQYLWCSEKIGLPVEKVKEVVEKWMFIAPNKYLLKAVFPGVPTFFKGLVTRNISIATLSDFPAKAKMNSMKLEADLNVSAIDYHISALKPANKGLEYILEYFKINNPQQHCLFIGDRQELDGVCALTKNVQFLLVPKNKEEVIKFYVNLNHQLNRLED